MPWSDDLHRCVISVRNHPVIVATTAASGGVLLGAFVAVQMLAAPFRQSAKRSRGGAGGAESEADGQAGREAVAETTGSAPATKTSHRPIASSRPGRICRGSAWSRSQQESCRRAWSRRTSSTSRRAAIRRAPRSEAVAASSAAPCALCSQACHATVPRRHLRPTAAAVAAPAVSLRLAAGRRRSSAGVASASRRACAEADRRRLRLPPIRRTDRRQCTGRSLQGRRSARAEAKEARRSEERKTRESRRDGRP